MKYFLIAGEASGDLHASHLMRSLLAEDPSAEFRFFGGDKMAAVGGELRRHYKELAYMGFIPVLLHLPTILKARRQCKSDIEDWQPDVVILVDYPGFNLPMAKFVKQRLPETRVFYYIPPKIWAWKEYRIKDIRASVDRVFSILPFEVPFYEQKHGQPVSYVGNPTRNEVEEFLGAYKESQADFARRHSLDPSKSIVALLPGSREQEVNDNLPMMIQATRHLTDHTLVVAGVSTLGPDRYLRHLPDSVTLLMDQTYELLAHASAALVTSGTATLEVACFRVPQVVMYKTPLPRLSRWVWDHLFAVSYISLVNLIADREVVPEMMADKFRAPLIRAQLDALLAPDSPARSAQLQGYSEVLAALTTRHASQQAAKEIHRLVPIKK